MIEFIEWLKVDNNWAWALMTLSAVAWAIGYVLERTGRR